MDAQNLRIEELLQKIKQQQYKLDKQNLQIKSLQSKVSTCPVLQPPPWPYTCSGHPGVQNTPAVPALVALLVFPGFGDPKGATALVTVLQCIISDVRVATCKLPESLYGAIGGTGGWEQPPWPLPLHSSAE